MRNYGTFKRGVAGSNPARLTNQHKALRGFTPAVAAPAPSQPVVVYRDYLHNLYKPVALAQLSDHWRPRAEREWDILAASSLGDRTLTEITASVIAGWWGHHVARGYPVAANKQRQALKQSLRYAASIDLIPKVPAFPKQVRTNPPRVRWLTPEQRTAILEDAAKHNPRILRYVWLAMHTLTRRASLARLDPKDIDLDREVIIYRRTKNGEDITAPMVPACTDMVRRWLAEPGPFLFPYSLLSGISQAFAAVRDRVGVTGPGAPNGDFSFHDLRHDLATRLVDAGVDLLVIKELGGWKTTAMVARYAHAKDAVKRAAMGRVFD